MASPRRPFRHVPKTSPAGETPLPPACQEAVNRLQQALAGGGDWMGALFSALGLWTLPQEVAGGRCYTYLIAGQAFDWPLLVHRLFQRVDGLLPEEARALVEEGRFPREVSLSEFRRAVGPSKYRAVLNFWYGVTVEQALHAAVADEVRKERLCRGLPPHRDLPGEVVRRIYEEGLGSLQRGFLRSTGRADLGPGEENAFTYWLFCQRLQRCEKARVASDTRKALEWLARRFPDQPLTPLLSLRWAVSTRPLLAP